MKTDGISVRVRNHLSELDRLAQEVADFGAAHQLNADMLFALNLSLEEIVTNVICYGYTDEAEHWIDVRVRHEAGKIVLEVEDDATAFNPLDRPDPNVDIPLELRPIGGLGIFLVRKLMDEVEYHREADHNRLTMRKRVPAP